MKLDKSKSKAGRFVGANRPTAETPSRPTIVQVQLKHPVEPVVESKPGAPIVAFSGPRAMNLSAFHQILQEHGVVKAEPSFRTHRAVSAESFAQPAAILDHEKKKYIDLHFPPGTDTDEVVRRLKALPEVEHAIVMPKAIPPRTLPGDPLVGASDQVTVDPQTGLEHEWYVFRCHADQAWATASGKNVVIADIDFGFLATHQDLAANIDMSHAHNSVDGSTTIDVGDDTDHGTGVLGLAAAATNAVGMAGFAYEATVWPIQANAGSGPVLPGDAFANAIDWVTAQYNGSPRVVINLEVQTGNFGNYEMVLAVNAAIRSAIAKGIVVCVAAGNGDRDSGIGDDGAPITPTGSILVGATQYDPIQNVRASFSNWGPRVVVSAPGDADHDVTCSTGSIDSYRNGFGGTSGATPKVSGTVGLMLEVNPSLTPAQVQEILVATGTPIPVGDNKPVGVFINTGAAVAQAAALTTSRSLVTP